MRFVSVEYVSVFIQRYFDSFCEQLFILCSLLVRAALQLRWLLGHTVMHQFYSMCTKLGAFFELGSASAFPRPPLVRSYNSVHFFFFARCVPAFLPSCVSAPKLLKRPSRKKKSTAFLKQKHCVPQKHNCAHQKNFRNSKIKQNTR